MRGACVMAVFDVRMVSVPPPGMASRALSATLRIAASSAAGSTSATPASRLAAVVIFTLAPSVRVSRRTMLSTSALIATGCGLSWRRREKASRSPVRSWPCRVARSVSSMSSVRRVVDVRQAHPQQLEVAEDHHQDVVEVVRDAAGQLADRFHLLRSKQRLPRLLERVLRRPQLGDVVRDAVDAEDPAVLVAVDALGDEVGLRAGVARRHALERHRLARRQHGLVVFDKALRGLFRIELEIAPADDLLGRAADEARRRLVDEHVLAFEILDENGVRRRVDDGEQDVRRVLDRLHARAAS